MCSKNFVNVWFHPLPISQSAPFDSSWHLFSCLIFFKLASPFASPIPPYRFLWRLTGYFLHRNDRWYVRARSKQCCFVYLIFCRFPALHSVCFRFIRGSVREFHELNGVKECVISATFNLVYVAAVNQSCWCNVFFWVSRIFFNISSVWTVRFYLLKDFRVFSCSKEWTHIMPRFGLVLIRSHQVTHSV